MADPIETQNAPHNLHHTDSHPAVLNKTESRQGSRNTTNARVLLISVTLCLIAGIVLYFFVY